LGNNPSIIIPCPSGILPQNLGIIKTGLEQYPEHHYSVPIRNTPSKPRNHKNFKMNESDLSFQLTWVPRGFLTPDYAKRRDLGAPTAKLLPWEGGGLAEQTLPRLVDDDSGSDSDSVSNDLTESAGSVLGSEKQGEADDNVAVMKEIMSAKRTMNFSRNVEVMNYDGAKGLSINNEPLFFGGMSRPPSENGVDSQGPVFETKVQFERADGDTLSWAAVVKKD
jgi:hypothetical protein